jgi:hypothetical protein
MTSWWNDQLSKWTVDEMTQLTLSIVCEMAWHQVNTWHNGHLMNCLVDEMIQHQDVGNIFFCFKKTILNLSNSFFEIECESFYDDLWTNFVSIDSAKKFCIDAISKVFG